ncbi:Aste57867_12266 [Aphanomyces stellatus]|uniref:Aste57867_12266 protein n=1 Tax=Aphanomyces stellatus TaxID=120398 RepID=A0A485KVX3_9STRA|nr:hypothetical protein As57867_012221 [Aphanomyces stellatus]VFT89119.1 Aste57867_12266 [Aphanomyces stellatus]
MFEPATLDCCDSKTHQSQDSNYINVHIFSSGENLSHVFGIQPNFLLAILQFDMNKQENVSVHGAICHGGIYEWNGEGRILAIVPSGRRWTRSRRCGNCGDLNHITIDCGLLTLPSINPASSICQVASQS